MKKLVIKFLTISFLLSGISLSANEPLITTPKTIQCINEKVIGYGKKRYEQQITKDRLIAAGCVAITLGGIYLQFFHQGKQTAVAPAPVQGNDSLQALQQGNWDVFLNDLPKEFPQQSMPFPYGNAGSNRNDRVLYKILGDNYTLNKEVTALKSNVNTIHTGMNELNYRVSRTQSILTQIAAAIGVGILYKMSDVLSARFINAFGTIQPVSVYIKSSTHLGDAHALVLQDAQYCKAHGYNDYYLQALVDSSNSYIHQLALSIGYMNYCADTFKREKDDAAYTQAKSITDFIMQTTNSFAQKMNDLIAADNKSRIHEMVIAYFEQMDTEIERFDQLIINR